MELFDIAVDFRTIDQAAEQIARNIPETFDNIEAEVLDWFKLGEIHYIQL